ncbi:Bud21p LALA0_S01e18074g [Lachancea lanzarotensis]|uniref:LALA0S01e18074g1_1 n=1 Tax=Lachancea lanzarotensis TaxID=1245769 RepID=A0A0C7N5M7_9SACH|nr:uncharacterized protein LALA0_S01e18074g [Lachancea lanzarotensis]CEP60749.1 LALA0S01e18074g1_1 [Lachancea lanzarotensis]
MVATVKHRKFGEESEALKDVPAEIPENNVSYHADNDSDSEDDDDDDAPEEAGLSSSKSTVERQESDRLRAVEREQELLKEKRRKQNSRFAEQQGQKRSKQMQDFEAVLKQREQNENNHDDNNDDIVPDQLPEDFFDNLAEQEARQITAKPTHVNFNDLNDEDFSADVKAELQKQKKKTLRHLRKTTLKRGPVKVTLLASMSSTRTLAPQKDSTVLNKKDKWLKRKALGRKR